MKLTNFIFFTHRGPIENMQFTGVLLTNFIFIRQFLWHENKVGKFAQGDTA